MKSRLLALALAGASLFVACGGSTSGGESIEGQDVQMFDNRFEYTEIEIPVGGTVTWLGAGRSAHNAVAANEEWSSERHSGVSIS